MPDKLEAYLEEIGHYLSGRAEREEILADIRGHLLEKAEHEFSGAGPAALEKAVAAYGPARRVAEKYLDGRPLIAPAYRRFLFRYTALLFAVHLAFTVFAVVFKKSFVLFPWVFMPRLGSVDAIMYLPMAFLADLGLVFLVLSLITARAKKDVKLPWPRFGVDLDEVKPARGAGQHVAGFLILLAFTDVALYLFHKYRTLFLFDFEHGSPAYIFTAEAGLRISLFVIALLAAGVATHLIKIFTSSRWVDVVNSGVSLVLLVLLLLQPFESSLAVSMSAKLLPKVEFGLTFLLSCMAAVAAFELVRSLVLLGRKRRVKR